MICKNCGYENKDTSAFCGECGAPLAQAAQQPKPAPAAAPAPAPAPQAPQQNYAPLQRAAAPVYAQPAALVYTEPQPEKKSGSGGKIALIIIAAVLALALIGGGVFGCLLYTQKTAEIESLEEEKAALESKLQKVNDEKEALSAVRNELSADYDALSADYDALTREHSSLQAEYDEMSYEKTFYEEEFDTIWPEYSFYHEHGIICTEKDKYYHSYDCPVIQAWDWEGCWIYNSEAGEYYGFTPCPQCQGG